MLCAVSNMIELCAICENNIVKKLFPVVRAVILFVVCITIGNLIINTLSATQTTSGFLHYACIVT